MIWNDFFYGVLDDLVGLVFDIFVFDDVFGCFGEVNERSKSVVELRFFGGLMSEEIAEALDITERTVKAHLSAIFEKLGVRDRVQLALAMNNIPTYSTVN